jgi:hypothetical protein
VTAERWQLAYEIYEAAAALAQPERSQYVRHVAPDAEIAAKVFAMLDEMEAIAGSDGFPEPSPSDHPTAYSHRRMSLKAKVILTQDEPEGGSEATRRQAPCVGFELQKG